MKKQNDTRLPVTVLSGFLGAGKTTLLQNILRQRSGQRIALIVNDAAEINIDGELIRDLVHGTEAQLVEMTNGCICCTLRADLLAQVAELARSGRYDYLIIESTGISEPLPVAATFSFVDETGFALDQIARLDTMVSLVDGAAFLEQYYNEDYQTEDGRSLADLLVEQVEFANVLLVTKSDLIKPADLEILKALLGKLNPTAQIRTSEFGQVDLAAILNTHLFDPEAASQFADWSAELGALHNPAHNPETLEYGISAHVYRARRPFHPQRLFDSLQNAPDGIVRIKGFFWMANQSEYVGYWSQAGANLRLEAKGKWWAATPRNQWPADTAWIDSRWQAPWGDRRQELVVIGIDLSPAIIDEFLDASLLTETEMDAAPWEALPDPFPRWNSAA